VPYRLIVFENGVLRICGLKDRKRGVGENYIIKRFIICSFTKVLEESEMAGAWCVTINTYKI
jgi:hypothetical protein